VNKTERAKEKEGDGKGDMGGCLCIPRMMQRQILHEAHDTPAGGHFGADRKYLHMKDRYSWKQMWRDTPRYVAGCDLCHRTNHRSGEPMGLLQPLPIAKGRWQRFGIDFITDLVISGNGHDCIVMFVDIMTAEHIDEPARKQSMPRPSRAYSSTTSSAYTDCIKRLYRTALYVSQQTIGDKLGGLCRRSCSCLRHSIQKWIVSLKTQTRWLYAIWVASQLTIKPIGTTTCH